MQKLLQQGTIPIDLAENTIEDCERVIHNFNSRIFFGSLVKENNAIAPAQLCHDLLLGNTLDFEKGSFANKLVADRMLFFVPAYYATQDRVFQYFTLFMNELKNVNNLTDEELGAFDYLFTTTKDYHCFCYKVGEIFKKSKGFSYIPLKLFRLAIVCNDQSTCITDAMTLEPRFEYTDLTMYTAFREDVLKCLFNLRYVTFGYNNFLGSCRISASNLRANEEMIKKEKEKEEQRERKLKELKRQVIRKNERPIMVRSRHPSHDELRDLHSTCRILIRLGSTTPTPPKMVDKCIEINNIEGVRTSSSKIRMKQAFAENGIPTSLWILPENEQDIRAFASQFNDKKNVKFVSKSEFGSRGEGNRLHESLEDLINFFNSGTNKYGRYIIEKYYSYSREYRLHVSSRGECFYACRKMLKNGTPSDQKWVRNDSTCVWILEENEMFDKPKTWDRIVQASVAAINAVGLDIGACDVRVNNEGQFIILETNSAPSFGDLTLEKYQEEIPKLAWDKMLKLSQSI